MKYISNQFFCCVNLVSSKSVLSFTKKSSVLRSLYMTRVEIIFTLAILNDLRDMPLGTET